MAYREQYERMMRWFRRCEHLALGRTHDQPSQNYVDEVHAFFLSCYHMKDWIKNDGEVQTEVRSAVENYIDNSRPLGLCADICNSLKHFRLDRSRSGDDPAFGAKRFKLALGEPSTISMGYEIETDNGPEDAFELAGECVRTWNEFLTKNKLLP